MRRLLENWCNMREEDSKITLKKITNFQNMPILISEALKEQIICGQISGGTQLKQEEIAKQFNVSLIPVREAIIQLESQGLVKCVRNKGAIVTELSIEEMNESFKLRIILETGALKQAIPNLLDEHIDMLEYLCTKMENERDPVKWSRLNWLFHESLYIPTENQKLMHVIEKLFVTIQRYTMLQLILTNDTKKANIDHRSIINMCKDKSIPKAIKLIEKHIESEQKELNRYMKNKED